MSEQPNVEKSQDERRILLSITVEIEDGRVEHIEMKEGDSAEEVSTSFCKKHELPLQFVGPLTEHIAHNLNSVSKEEDSVKSSSPERKDGVKSSSKRLPVDRKQKRNDKKYTDLLSQARKAYKMEKPAIAQSSKKSKVHKFSERLLQHTYTFSTKTIAADIREKRERSRKMRRPDLSDKMKAICLRLYSDFLKQRQRIQEDAKLFAEQFQDKLNKEKPVCSLKSRRLMRSREKAAEQFRNYGELLYQEAITKDQERKKLIEKKQQEDEINELKLLSSKPEISKFAKQLQRHEIVWDRLGHDKQNQEHLQVLRNELLEARLMECTFKPRINYLHLDKRDTATSTRFEQLFYDAEHRRQRQAEYMQWFPDGVTFRPHINKNEYEVGHEGSVFDRLLQYAERLTERKQKPQDSPKTDPLTGQELFRPLTGRHPNFERNAECLPIGEFLYQMRFAIENKKQNLLEIDHQARVELAKCHYVGPKSEHLLDKLRARRLTQVFEYLDKDKDGSIDLADAETSQLADEVIQQIEEVKTMDESKRSLSYDTFAELMEVARQRIGGSGLHAAIKRCEGEEKFPFKFKMCPLSKAMSTRRRKFSSNRQWYKLILLDRQQMIAKVEAMRKERHKQEMAECTFKPAVHPGGKSRLGHHRRPHISSSSSTVVEKEKQEVHGFIFQESQEGATSSGGAKGLIESFKDMVKPNKDEQAEVKKTFLSDVPEQTG